MSPFEIKKRTVCKSGTGSSFECWDIIFNDHTLRTFFDEAEVKKFFQKKQNFKVGQIVRCVKRGWPASPMTVGSQYQVLDINKDYNGGIRIEEDGFYHPFDCFETLLS